MTEQEEPSLPQKPHRVPLWTVTDVAEFFKLSEAYVYELARTGRIPCGKIGKLYRFDQTEIEAWWKIRKRR